MTDPYLGTCVSRSGFPVCGRPTSSPRGDFCEEHEDESCMRDGDNFGRCYQCHDGLHDLCIGVPCQCQCPTPDQRERQRLREQALNKLTPHERAALGVSE